MGSLKILRASLESRAHGQVYALPLARDDRKAAGRGAVHECISSAEQELNRILAECEPEGLDGIIRVRPIGNARRANGVPESVHAACTMYEMLERRVDQPPRETDRMAGVLWTPDEDTFDLVHQVNWWKAQLEAAVARVKAMDAGKPGRIGKILASHPALRHVHLIQAYRRIPVLATEPTRPREKSRPLPVYAASFSWSGNSRVVLRVARAQLIEQLRASSVIDGASGYATLLEGVSGTFLAKVRPLSPMPLVNLRIDNPTSDPVERSEKPTLWGERLPAAMPLIVFGHQPPEIVPLGDFHPAAPRQAARSDTNIKPEPLIKALGIYEYIE
ncbi:MAG: hypothetical protein E6Q76_07525, partial [Rhizobium sp.]